MGAGLSIGEVADATGMSVHALRFFEREGLLLRPIPRSSSGQRVYDHADVEWLLLFKRFRDSGMPIAMIKEFSRLVRSGPGNEPARLALLEAHERQVQARIAELQDSLEIIHGKVAAYAEHVRAGTAADVWSPAPANS